MLAAAWVFVVLTHLTLLRLPYFWDEGGYYVPAALDFFHTGSLIPVFTNAHPPLPSVAMGAAWHIFGFHIPVTRLTACTFAAGGLGAVYLLGYRLLGRWPALALAVLTAVYPVWFAQSSLAHADIFAAAFTLWALLVYLSSPAIIGSRAENMSETARNVALFFLFSASVLAKETAIVQPAALAAVELWQLLRLRKGKGQVRDRLARVLALLGPVPVLACWYAYHFLKTGFAFGNPVYLRYNATANFNLAHVVYGLRIRFVHLAWQRNLWVPLLLAAACLVLSQPDKPRTAPSLLGLPRPVVTCIAVLVSANLLAFSVLGGALLTRYLLPVYPLLLLLCVAAWVSRTPRWPWLAGLAAAAFVSAIWLNPDTFFAPEDNLTYRNMIVVQQQAIDYLNQHYPEATVLTAWPASADLFKPELGYTTHRFRVFSLENFTLPELHKAAADPGAYDTALVFTTHYTSPGFRRFLLSHPTSWRGRRYAADLDLTPAQIARMLGGEVVWQNDIYGEWAAVLRFPRNYNAQLLTAGPVR